MAPQSCDCKQPKLDAEGWKIEDMKLGVYVLEGIQEGGGDMIIIHCYMYEIIKW